MKILVLDAHANASLAIVQSLGRAGHEIELAGAAPGPLSWSSRYPRKRWLYPDPLRDPSAFGEWLKDIERQRGFDLILPVTDSSIHPAMDLLRQGWGEKSLVLPPPDAFDWVYNKAKTLEMARQCDVRVPASVEIDSLDWSTDPFTRFPYYAKPVQSKVWSQGSGQNLAPQLARDENELRRAVDRFLRVGAVSIQEYISGWGVGLGVLCEDGEILAWFAYRRVHEYPLTGGASTYRVSTEPPAGLLEASGRMLAWIRWSGVAMVEFKQFADELVLMEINGRFWGSLPLAIASGVDFPRYLIDLLGNGTRPRQPSYRRGLYVRRIDTDFAWMKENLRADKDDNLLLTRPVGRSLIEPLRLLAGRERWDHGTWRDPAPILVTVSRTIGSEVLRRVDQLRAKLVVTNARRTTQRRLHRQSVRRLLVVCYGNICRSPFVERYLRSRLTGHHCTVRSTGFHETEGRRSPADFARASSEVGVALGDHRSSRISSDLVNWADSIVIMDRDNWRRMRLLGRQATKKTVWLGAALDKGSVEIPDPYGRSEDEMRGAVTRMQEASDALVVRFLQKGHVE